MKRLIAAATLGVILLVVYFLSYFYITDACKKTTDLLNECRIAYDQKSNAEEKAKEINDYWNKKEQSRPQLFFDFGELEHVYELFG
jgi:glutaredoxin